MPPSHNIAVIALFRTPICLCATRYGLKSWLPRRTMKCLCLVLVIFASLFLVKVFPPQQEQNSRRICWWNCTTDKWLESEWITAWRPLMRPRWGRRLSEEGLGGRWKQLQLFPWRKAFAPPLQSLSRFYFSCFPGLAASTLHFILSPPLPLTSSYLAPTHPHTCTVLCVALPFYYQVKL